MFHRKLFQCQGRTKTGNLAVFPAVMDFGDQKIRTGTLLELGPTGICHGNCVILSVLHKQSVAYYQSFTNNLCHTISPSHTICVIPSVLHTQFVAYYQSFTHNLCHTISSSQTICGILSVLHTQFVAYYQSFTHNLWHTISP